MILAQEYVCLSYHTEEIGLFFIFHFCFSEGECKLQMEKKFQEFKKLTGDVFKEELQHQLQEKSEKLKELSTKLIRENHELTNRNRELETTLADLTKHNSELKVRLNELSEQHNDLLTALKERRITLTENRPDES